MSAVPQARYTYEEYLVRERAAEYKNEFYRGEIFAMSGGTPQHNVVSGNIFAGLHARLRGSGCRPYNSDQRIRIPGNTLGTYPDVSVVCGDRQPDEQDRDAIINPRVIVEVLSPSTEKYNRGKKFDLYRDLPSLREYVLVSQDEPLIERFFLAEDGEWRLTIHKDLATTLEFRSIECQLPLAEIYDGVDFTAVENSPA